MINPSEATMFAVISGTILAAMSLLAIWAAFSQRPWHHRAIVLLGTLALLLPTGAYEPILFVAVQGTLTIGLLLAVRRLPAARRLSDAYDLRTVPRPRFQLIDLCWLVTLSAVGTAILTFAAKHSTPFALGPFLGQAAIAAAIAVTASIAVLVRWRPLGRIITMALFVSVAGRATIWFHGMQWTVEVYSLVSVDIYTIACIIDASLILLALLTWKGMQRPIASERSRAEYVCRDFPRRISWFVLTSLALIVAVLFPWLYWQMAVLPPIPEVVDDPRPNRFAELVAIGEQLENVNIPDIDVDDPKVLATFADEHKRLLDDARDLLRDRCHEVLDWTEDPDALTRRIGRSAAIFQLAHAYDESGTNAVHENHFEEAWKDGAVLFDLARAEADGGLLIDLLAGLHVKNMAIGRCRRMRSGLSPSQCVSLLDFLRSHRQDFESVDVVLDRDLSWCAYTLGWIVRLQLASARLAGTARDSGPIVQSAILHSDAEFHLLVTDLAIQIFRDRHGRLPDTLGELTPEILPESPVDPFTDARLIYRRDGADYALYSVGQNKVDDGGMVVTDSGKKTVIAGQRHDAFFSGEWIDRDQGDLFLDADDWIREVPVDEEAVE